MTETAARLRHVILRSNDNLSSHCEVTIKSSKPGSFSVAIITGLALTETVKSLIEGATYTYDPLASRAKIGITVKAFTYEDAVGEARRLFGTYFALGAPMYWYSNDVLLTDRVPGNHRFLSIPTEEQHDIEELKIFGDALADAGVPPLSLFSLSGVMEIQLNDAPDDYLVIFAKIAAQFGG